IDEELELPEEPIVVPGGGPPAPYHLQLLAKDLSSVEQFGVLVWTMSKDAVDFDLLKDPNVDAGEKLRRTLGFELDWLRFPQVKIGLLEKTALPLSEGDLLLACVDEMVSAVSRWPGEDANQALVNRILEKGSIGQFAFLPKRNSPAEPTSGCVARVESVEGHQSSRVRSTAWIKNWRRNSCGGGIQYLVQQRHRESKDAAGPGDGAKA
ncbi:unnamed protein product, partial [Amoebophrya sp. A120]